MKMKEFMKEHKTEIIVIGGSIALTGVLIIISKDIKALKKGAEETRKYVELVDALSIRNARDIEFFRILCMDNPAEKVKSVKEMIETYGGPNGCLTEENMAKLKALIEKWSKEIK